MSAATFLEDLSPFQIAALTQIARHRLSCLVVRQDYSLRHVVGHTILLDNLKMEAESKNKEKMAREASADNLAPGSREAPQAQSSAIVTVSELADVDRSSVQEGGRGTGPRASGPVHALYWSQQALAELPTEESLYKHEENREDEISNESKERLLQFHRYLSHMVEAFEKSDDDFGSESNSESDESESDDEEWK